MLNQEEQNAEVCQGIDRGIHESVSEYFDYKTESSEKEASKGRVKTFLSLLLLGLTS